MTPLRPVIQTFRKYSIFVCNCQAIQKRTMYFSLVFDEFSELVRTVKLLGSRQLVFRWFDPPIKNSHRIWTEFLIHTSWKYLTFVFGIIKRLKKKLIGFVVRFCINVTDISVQYLKNCGLPGLFFFQNRVR